MEEYETLDRLVQRARVLPTMLVNRKMYFVDSRLRELRNVADPADIIRCKTW